MACAYEVDRIGMKKRPMIELIIEDPEERLRFEMQLIGQCRRIIKEYSGDRRSQQSEAGWNGSGTINLRVGKFKFKKLPTMKDGILSPFFKKSNEILFTDPYHDLLVNLVQFNKYGQFEGGTPIIYKLNGMEISFRMLGFNANGGVWRYSGLSSSDYYKVLKVEEGEKLSDFRVSVESLMDSIKYYEYKPDPKEIADRLHNYRVQKLTERIDYFKRIGHLESMKKAQQELKDMVITVSDQEPTKEHRLALPSISHKVLLTLDDKKALRPLIDADIKFRNPQLRGYCLRIEDIARINNVSMLEVKCKYRVVIKQFER